MKKWRMYRVFFLLLICTVSLVGCNRTRIIDKLSIIHVFGFDQAENGDLIGTALFPEYTKSKSSDEIQYLQDQAATTNLLIPKMATLTSTPVEIAKIRVLLLGKNFAEAGIQDIVDRLILTPQIGTSIQIAVSTHSARETLSVFKKEKSLTLAERIKHNIDGQSLPDINLHFFLNHFYGEGMDAFAPMLTIDENSRVKIDGIGVFKGDKFTLHLNPEQTSIFALLRDYRSMATLKIGDDGEDNPKELITVRAFRNKKHWDWDRNKKELHLRLDLEMTLIQYPKRYKVENEEDIREMKKKIVEKLGKRIGDLLTILKENEVDPLGIGNIVRSQDRTWQAESFYQEYPSLPINVNVNLQIIHTGLKG